MQTGQEFENIELVISEMNRLGRSGRQVIFGGESVATHLSETDCRKMSITNKSLWEAMLPVLHLSSNALNIQTLYVLGNCFTLFALTKKSGYRVSNLFG